MSLYVVRILLLADYIKIFIYSIYFQGELAGNSFDIMFNVVISNKLDADERVLNQQFLACMIKTLGICPIFAAKQQNIPLQ
jgi:hypothetical protein